MITKEREKENNIKKGEGALSSSWPLLPLRPMVCAHYMCVWPSLVVSFELDHVRSSHRYSSFKYHSHMLPVNTLRYAKVNKDSPNSSTHICLHKNTIWSCEFMLPLFML
jgi:hypothetical protein